jgi:hypothetical protein
MKFTYTTAGGRLSFQGDGNRKQVIEQLSAIQDVFDEPCCSACKSTAIIFTARNYRTQNGEDRTNYGYKCLGCTAQLDILAKNDGVGLFIKRKDKEGRPVGVNGWYIYEKKAKSAAEPGDSQPDPYDADPGDAPF